MAAKYVLVRCTCVAMCLTVPGGSHSFLLDLVLILQDFISSKTSKAFFFGGRHQKSHVTFISGSRKVESSKDSVQIDLLNLKTSCTLSTISRLSAVRRSCLADKLVIQTSVVARGKKVCILTNRFTLPSAGIRMF